MTVSIMLKARKSSFVPTDIRMVGALGEGSNWGEGEMGAPTDGGDASESGAGPMSLFICKKSQSWTLAMCQEETFEGQWETKKEAAF